MKLTTIEEQPSPTLPGNFLQNACSVDTEITMRLTRAIWRSLRSGDPALKMRLNAYLQEEIDALMLQHEIDGTKEDDVNISVAHLLQDYLGSDEASV